MQQQQLEQDARLAASAEASSAAGASDPGAAGSSSLAVLGEDTSVEEEEALEALLGLTAHASNSHHSQTGEDVIMSEADEEGASAVAPQ